MRETNCPTPLMAGQSGPRAPSRHAVSLTVAMTYTTPIGIARAEQEAGISAISFHIRSHQLGRVRLMLQTLKSKSSGRGQRHSAAWGKRLSTLLLVLIAGSAFSQSNEGAS